MFNIDVVGIKYKYSNTYGDFYWMCNQPQYNNSLFIFNDNEEYHYTCKKGVGNAVIRIYNKYSLFNIPKSAGIPTGTLMKGGYMIFDENVKKNIDYSFDDIVELIKKHGYRTLYYSSELDGKLGTSIFKVNSTVIDYITSKIHSLTIKPIQIVNLIPPIIFNKDEGILEKVK